MRRFKKIMAAVLSGALLFGNIGVMPVAAEDVSYDIAYMEDFNDASTLTPTLKSETAQRYEDDYSEQVAAYARAHSSTNDVTKQDFYGKKVDGENSYLYMRSSGKIVTGNTYYTSFTFANISVDIEESPLWIEMDLKALEQRVDRYEFYVNGTKLFQETEAAGIASTGSHALGESEFSTLSLKFADGLCYAYINGENEIELGEFTLEAFESFQIKIYPSTDDVLETGNAGICIDNVAVYTNDTQLDVFAEPTGVTINEGDISLQVAETQQLTATVETEGIVPQIVWTSDDESVATVSSDGVVTANKVGKATISAKAGSVTDTCTVIVGIDSLVYKEDFNDAAKTLTPTTSGARYKGTYTDYIAADTRAHSTATNEATEADFFGKITDKENGYLYMRSSGKYTTSTDYTTKLTFSGFSAMPTEGEPVWIQMNLKYLEQKVYRCRFYVNDTIVLRNDGDNDNEIYISGSQSRVGYSLFNEDGTFKTLFLKFDGTNGYAYVDGTEIALGEIAIEELTSFKVDIYGNEFDIIGDEKANAGVCIDNVAVYTGSEQIDLFAPKVKGTTLSLDGNIGVNFHADLGGYVGREGSYMKLTLPNKAQDEVQIKFSEATKDEETGYYMFTGEVSAKDMTGNIKVEMFEGNRQLIEPVTYTVYDNAKYILDNSDETAANYSKEYANAAPLVNALLNYGAYAQTYFDVNEDNLANQSLSEDEKSVAAVTAESIGEQTGKNIGTSTDVVSFYGASLSLKSETALNYYFKLTEGDIDTFTFLNGDTELEVNKSGTLYYVKKSDISAVNLANMYTVSVMKDTDEVLSVSYSAFQYAYDVLSTESDLTGKGEAKMAELQDVVRAMYLYQVAAETYQNLQSGSN